MSEEYVREIDNLLIKQLINMSELMFMGDVSDKYLNRFENLLSACYIIEDFPYNEIVELFLDGKYDELNTLIRCEYNNRIFCV